MIYLKVAILIACIVLGILFGVSNQQPAALALFSFATKAMPLYVLLLMAFLAGAVLAFAYTLFSGSDAQSHMGSTKERIRELEKLVKEQHSQIDTLRSARAQGHEERKPAGQPTPELAEKA